MCPRSAIFVALVVLLVIVLWSWSSSYARESSTATHALLLAHIKVSTNRECLPVHPLRQADSAHHLDSFMTLGMVPKARGARIRELRSSLSGDPERELSSQSVDDAGS